MGQSQSRASQKRYAIATTAEAAFAMELLGHASCATALDRHFPANYFDRTGEVLIWIGFDDGTAYLIGSTILTTEPHGKFNQASKYYPVRYDMEISKHWRAGHTDISKHRYTGYTLANLLRDEKACQSASLIITNVPYHYSAVNFSTLTACQRTLLKNSRAAFLLRPPTAVAEHNDVECSAATNAIEYESEGTQQT